MFGEMRNAIAHVDRMIEIGRDDIAGSGIDAVYEYWENRRDGAFAPPRRRFRLDDLPASVIPCMAMIDFVGTPVDYYYRFFGSKMVEVAGRELTGKRYFADAVEGYGFVNAQLFPLLVERKVPMIHRVNWISDRGLRIVTTSVRLPLSEDGEAVSGAVTANDYRSPVH